MSAQTQASIARLRSQLAWGFISPEAYKAKTDRLARQAKAARNAPRISAEERAERFATLWGYS